MMFSVLMSLYARERPDFLRQSLDSIFGQTLPPDEVVLVEDGPLTPELYAVLDEYSSAYTTLKRIRLVKNGGLGRALREGIRHCSHDLVARMDTDDIAMPQRFEKQVAFMTRNPDIAASSSWIQEFEGCPDNPKSIKKVPATEDEVNEFVKTRNPLNHPAVIFRKKAVDKVGSYLHFPLFEDWYLWARMSAAGMKMANLPECLLFFRVSPDVYRRRGGWRYARESFRFQMTLSGLGLISRASAFRNGTLRAMVYLMPNSVRAQIYNRILRK